MINPTAPKNPGFPLHLFNLYFPTHADIVVEVGNGNALAVGGNKLRGMVDYESYPLDDDDGTPMSEAVIAVLRKES